MSLVCPKCRRADRLWEDVMVPGWRCVEVVIRDGRREVRKGSGESDVEWYSGGVESQGGIYCSPECGWSGTLAELIQLGIDGEALPADNPRQEVLPI